MPDELYPSKGESIEDIWEDYMRDSADVMASRRTFFGRVALGNGTAFDIGMMWVDRDGETVLLVSVIDFGAATFSQYIHYTYAMEKLGLREWDARNLSDFINCQLGLREKPQGKYEHPGRP